MLLNVSRVDTWTATIDDRVGGAMEKLEGLARAGASLEFVLARRAANDPGRGVLFVTPLTPAQSKAAAAMGFEKTDDLHAIRVDGPDQPGLAYLVTRALAGEGLNLRGMSATKVGHECVIYFAFDTAADADKAAARLALPI